MRAITAGPTSRTWSSFFYLPRIDGHERVHQLIGVGVLIWRARRLTILALGAVIALVIAR